MIAVVALVPASILTIAGGALFGVERGALYGLTGATLGSAAAFLLSRHVVRHAVVHRLRSRPRLTTIERAVSTQGLRVLLLLRLSPIVPFNVLNYALGLTTIRLRDFLLASAGMIPGALMYAYCGKVGGLALMLAGEAEVPRNASYYAFVVAGLAATIGATAVVTRAARKALGDV